MMDVEIRTCGPKGPYDSTFAIVGEAPGKQEIIKGEPFVGPSGQVLNFALDQGNTVYPSPYFTNTFKSLIVKEKDPAFLSQLAMECRPKLLEELRGHPRRVILALGSVALQALTGDTSLKITQVRGKIFASEAAEVGVVAAVHPAFLLRGNGSLRQFKADVAHAIRIAQGLPPIEWKYPTWSVVKSESEFREHIARARLTPPTAFIAGDIETGGFRFRTDKVLSMGYTFDGNHVYIVNGYKSGVPTEYPNLLHLFKDFWDSPARFVWHNGKFDVKFFRQQYGQHNCRCDDDTMLMSYALDEQRGIHDLETVAGDWIYSPNWKNVLDKYLPKKNSSYDLIPWEVLFRYQAYDIANTYRLAVYLSEKIAADPTSLKQYTKSLMPASEFLIDIETNGIMVDEREVGKNGARLEEAMKPHTAAIHTIAEEVHKGNWTDKLVTSPKQMAELIFDDLKLVKKSPRLMVVRSTQDDNLDKLQAHPVLTHLRAHRTLAKSYGTYVKPFTRHPEDGYIEDDGRVHASYLIHGTATGRLSSRNPNMQNIPRDSTLRGQFIAPYGRMFIEPDLNQAELRSLAILSGDPELCKIYLEGKTSLHEKVRAQIFGMPSDWSQTQVEFYLRKFHLTPETRYNPETGEDKIVLEQKMKAKNVNFGIIYGITEAGLAEQTGELPSECKHWLEVWAQTFPIAWQFITACRKAPLYGKNLVTVFGYRKRFQIATQETITAIQNEAANFPHQNTASVITMQAGIRTYERLRAFDAFFVNTVHDSLIVECPRDYAIALAVTRLICSEAEQVPRDWGLTQIPFQADAKWGTRWGSLTDPRKYAKIAGWEPSYKEAA